MASDPILKAESIFKTYSDASHCVLKGIEIEVRRGDLISIVGASGSGKSTLLHILGTIDTPTSGSVFFEGDDLGLLSDERLAKFRSSKLGFVFQFHHLLPEFTALENVMIPLWLRGLPSREKVARGSRALSEVGLAGKSDSLPSELSGGEQQRVAVARAIVGEPQIVLADEPTGNLDSGTGDRLMGLLFDLNKGRNLTLIYVSHNERLAAMAGRRLVLKDGKLEKC